MTKKITIILTTLILITSIAFGIRYYFFNTSIQTNTATSTSFTNNIFGFLGIGSDNQNVADQPINKVSNTNTLTNTVIPTLRHITENPVAGATFVGTSTIRYANRGNGHIFETPTNSLETVKISNTTIPKVYEAYWVNNGENVIYRRLKENTNTIETSFLELRTKTGSTTDFLRDTIITFLPDNITDLAVSVNTDNIAYILPIDSSAQITTSNPDGSSPSSFSIPHPSWTLSWTDSNILTIVPKTASNVLTSMYSISKTKNLMQEIDDNPGLTILNTPKRTLYSFSTKNSLFLEVKNSDDLVILLYPSTLPEKCTPTDTTHVICGVPTSIPQASYPENWYQGVVSFIDEIRTYNLETGESVITYTPQEEFDIINPQISSDGKYFMFTNKKDLSLWVLNLDEVGEETTVNTF